MERLQQLEDRLTGALTTQVRVRRVERPGPPGPRMPSWWHGDEDASRSSTIAMQQITR